MNDLLLIGQFATLAGISSRMLRHYDKLGLIAPVSIDATTGYRYYADHQLTTIQHITVLQNYGFSLSDITEIIHQKISLEAFANKLKDKEILLRQSIDADTGHLINIHRTIAFLSENETTPGLTPSINLDQLILQRSHSMTNHPTFDHDQLRQLKERALRLPNSMIFTEQINDYIEANSNNLKHFISFDLDGFASINDLYGYDVGDLVIFTSINTILASFDDLLKDGKGIATRYGGDEVVIFTSKVATELIVTRVTSAIETIRRTDWASLGCLQPMTVSCGIYSFTECDNVHAPRHNSGKALMEAKRLGRDQYKLTQG